MFDAMRTLIFLFFICGYVLDIFSYEWNPRVWPVLKTYDRAHLYNLALPVGGIGTGTVSLGGRGELRDWEIMNVPAKKYSTVTTGNNAPFFAIYARPHGGKPKTLMLAGKLYEHEYLHYEGRSVDHHGLPRFDECSFDAAYPFGQVHLQDNDMPVSVTLKAFNPLIPGDADMSGLPIAILNYEVVNNSDKAVDVSICGSIRNFIGKDGSEYIVDKKGDYVPVGSKNNKNIFKSENHISGLYFYSDGVDIDSPAYGNFALTTNSVEGVSYRTSSVKDSWNNAILNFWDDFSSDGKLVELKKSYDEDPMGSLAVYKTILPGESKNFSFFITWNFPNRKSWSSTVVGNYYSKKYNDAWKTAEDVIPQIPYLEEKTLSFVNAILGCSYPDVVKEAALFNLSTLRSQTVFRLPSGHMMGWEGVMDRFGSCYGSCTHVWNYEMATPFLFGELARSMREVEFFYSTKENGLMNFRAALPLSEASKGNHAAADGQLGCIMKFYRDWQLSGDNDWLRENWEQIKKVLSYTWIENGWDADCDGVMEGRQHNTMDVDYFGPNPQMQFWYMGALKASIRMADFMGDKHFKRKCNDIYKKASSWVDDNLFNGEYYEHIIYNPKTRKPVNLNDSTSNIPPFQLGKGCLVDQLVGQYMAHICGLGYLADKNNIQKTLQSIMKYNYVEDFSDHFNNMRSYVLGDESGLLMASWPKGRLKVPFPYFSEVMTGFEYSTAVSMIYEGMTDDALKCVNAIRERHDGAKRNPFSEPECGHHYARAMASWGLILSLSGFNYSAVDSELTVTSNPGKYFWSNGYSWGTFTVENDMVEIEVISGNLKIKRLKVGDRIIKIQSQMIDECGERIMRFDI